jgi:ABC-type transport system substrate-binding protein
VTVDSVIIPAQRQREAEYRATFPAFQFKRINNTLQILDQRMGSAFAPIPENHFTGTNDPRYMNSEVDALIDRFYSTVDLSARTPILGQLMHIVSDQVVFMGLFYVANATLIDNRLANVRAASEYATQVWNVQDWTTQ